MEKCFKNFEKVIFSIHIMRCPHLFEGSNADAEGVVTPLPSVQEEDSGEGPDGEATPKAAGSAAGSAGSAAARESEQDSPSLSELLSSAPPLVSMVSKHSNGKIQKKI